MEYNLKKRVSPSAAAFMDGKRVDTEYSSGCHRNILAGRAGLKSHIPEKYTIMGEMNELFFYRKLVDSGKYALILDEVEFSFPIVGDVVASGRFDFATWEHDSDQMVIHELKSTMSSGTLGMAKRGEIKLNQLAQIATYLILYDLPLGYLRVLGYSEKKSKETGELEIKPKIRRDTKEHHEYCFEITFSENRDILVDGRLSGYTSLDLVNNISTTAEMIMKPYVAERPIGWEDDRGPCSWCSLKDVCDKTDEENLTWQQFVTEALKLNEGAQYECS